MKSRIVTRISILAFLSTFSTGAAAQERGFALNRFNPAERGSRWFVLDSLDFTGKLRASVGLTADVTRDPLVIRDATTSTSTTVVGDQLVLHMGGSLVFLERFRVGVNVPLSLYQSGTGGTVQGQTIAPPSSNPVAGDVRIGGDVRLFGKTDEVVTMAAGMAVFVPSGSAGSFSGDGTARVEPRALVAGRVGKFVYGGKLGITVRPAETTLAGNEVGSELTFAASAGASLLDHRLLVGPELHGATAFTGPQGMFARETTPVEALLGAHFAVSDFRFGLGAGPGLSRGFGSPSVRGLASVEWAPRTDVRAPEPDRDRDRVADARDRCPDVPGLVELAGCPAERHEEVMVAKAPVCDVPPGAPRDPACPPLVVASNPDEDGDGILDTDDACPDEPGPKDADPTRNGCPRARIQDGQIRILDPVKFRFGSAELDPASDPVLDGVLKILESHEEIKTVRIEGHTDSMGNAKINGPLSANRAAAVRSWLTNHGIAPTKLSSEGFGATRPRTTNESDEGRRENRRVEFHIVGGK
ncbi:MAG: OmpA family protein [Polyangiaceae bacterium]